MSEKKDFEKARKAHVKNLVHAEYKEASKASYNGKFYKQGKFKA